MTIKKENTDEVVETIEEAPEETTEVATEVAEEEAKEEAKEETTEEAEEATEEAEEVTEEAEEVTEEATEETTEEAEEEAKEEAEEEATEETEEVTEETTEEVTEENNMNKKYKIGLLLLVVIMLVVFCYNNLNNDESNISNPQSYVTVTDDGYMFFDNVMLADYLNVILTQPDESGITDEYFENELEMMVQYATPSTTVSRAAKDGDVVNFDYVGIHNGNFLDSSEEGFELIIGSETFFKSFEEQLIGGSAGEQLDVYITYPDDFNNDDLKGEEVLFEVTINEVKQRIPNELTDEFVQAVSETSNTVEEYKLEFREMLIKEQEDNKMNMLKSEAWAYLESQTMVESYDEEVLQEIEEQMYTSYEKEAAYYGITLSEYILGMGYSDEAIFKASLSDSAIYQYIQKAIVHNIITSESMVISDEEMLTRTNDILEMIGMPDLDTAIETGYSLDDIELNVLMGVVLEFVIENATFY